jgi:hypothetical protein
MVLTDGTRSYQTFVAKVRNTKPGKAGLWLFQIGDRQEFGNFELSATKFTPVEREIKGLRTGDARGVPKGLPLAMHENPNVVPAVEIPPVTILPGGDYKLGRLPAPQDWVLVLERVKP